MNLDIEDMPREVLVKRVETYDMPDIDCEIKELVERVENYDRDPHASALSLHDGSNWSNSVYNAASDIGATEIIGSKSCGTCTKTNVVTDVSEIPQDPLFRDKPHNFIEYEDGEWSGGLSRLCTECKEKIQNFNMLYNGEITHFDRIGSYIRTTSDLVEDLVVDDLSEWKKLEKYHVPVDRDKITSFLLKKPEIYPIIWHGMNVFVQRTNFSEFCDLIEEELE